METRILEVSVSGFKISLTDGTEWVICNIDDIIRTLLWYPAQRIKIEEDILINLDTSGPDKVRVIKLS